ncbi:helix-turn-helix domain-containing protein [Burkholderia sp. L27(2015)]|uniref:helix-turn-helix domain-containing protein n=1 Tax=Burkholderia sp. L27(2015) TaxID=1641858 RepID=UPI00349E975C
MIELLLELAPNEGYNLSPLPDIRFLRSNRPLTRTPVLYEPGIVIVCQGRKRGYLGVHAHFKTMTDTSPLQYIKSTRLHQARLLMARQRMTVAAASAQVGYESPSRFSREFKRLFGGSPLQEIARMKRNFAWPDEGPPSIFVSSH